MFAPSDFEIIQTIDNPMPVPLEFFLVFDPSKYGWNIFISSPAETLGPES